MDDAIEAMSRLITAMVRHTLKSPLIMIIHRIHPAQNANRREMHIRKESRPAQFEFIPVLKLTSARRS
jgi:hypothetical protein